MRKLITVALALTLLIGVIIAPAALAGPPSDVLNEKAAVTINDDGDLVLPHKTASEAAGNPIHVGGSGE